MSQLIISAVAAAVSAAIAGTFVYQFIKAKKIIKQKDADLARYSAISDAEAEAERIKAEAVKDASGIISNANDLANENITQAEELADCIEAKAATALNDANKKADVIVKQAKETADLLVAEAKDENKNMAAAIVKAKSELQSVNGEIRLLRDSYKEKKSVYDRLLEQVKLYQDQNDLADLAHYEPIFAFDTSEEYKANIVSIRDKQKEMLKDKEAYPAISCAKDWTVGNSRREGQKMVNRAMTLSMRAFNGECEAAIASCTFRNYPQMRARITRAYTAVNKSNEVLEIVIHPEYYNLKLEELQAVYEYNEKKQQEKEEQKALREQIRDEERAQREIEKAIREAEEEERRTQKALDKARKEMEAKLAVLTAEQSEKHQAAIAELEAALADAQAKGERALSMAQQTKRGHVYIISNIGSFGENVFKIGLTRRLDPQDRVDELGSASVPFLFDVHAMIKSDDAPALETALHQHFDGKRTNAINRRKEFFNVTLDEIKAAVKEISGDGVDFVETATAQHYYETLALRKAEKAAANESPAEAAAVKVPEFAEAI